MYGSYEEAGESYQQAQETYVPKLLMQYTGGGEGGVFVPGAGILPPDVPVQNPLAWHPISQVWTVTEHEASEVLYLFGIELPTVEADIRAPEEASAGGEEAETSV